jgi:hypothetical protein
MGSNFFVPLLFQLLLFVAPSPLYAELTMEDIARFDEGQRYTYDRIGIEVSVLNFGPTRNNSTLSDREIQNQIMEYFILNGYDYCDKWKGNLAGGYCNNLMETTYEDDLVKDKYIEIIQQNQPGPFNLVSKFFDALFG